MQISFVTPRDELRPYIESVLDPRERVPTPCRTQPGIAAPNWCSKVIIPGPSRPDSMRLDYFKAGSSRFLEIRVDSDRSRSTCQ